MVSVQIHQVSHVAVFPSPVTETELLLPLSFFDVSWISIPPIRRLLLFPAAPDLHSLKSSLSAVLRLFYPLAGKLTYLPATGDLALSCSPDDHVTFIEADSDGDFTRLASDEIHDVDSFLRLVPELDVKVLPAAVMEVQVTRFDGGSVAVGLAIHHAVVDGRGFWLFVQAWAMACRAGEEAISGVSLVHDRTFIRHHPRGDKIARRLLKKMAPELPIINTQRRFEATRRTFTISRDMIRSMKQRAKEGRIQYSTFAALSALTWISLIKTKAMEDPNEETILGFSMDCRTRLNPPLNDGYYGNCIRGCFAKAKAVELAGSAGFSMACMRIKEEIDESCKDVLRGYENSVGGFFRDANSIFILLNGSSSFRAYETDFGVGRPSRVEPVSMSLDGQVALIGGREEGEIQMSVALNPPHMEEFTKEFLRELNA
ncbi:anthocyanin 5-aromatic acyltransferase-like [Dioscorea cayenensis subsp. rotundata]|uniref:Anthocyanin 5-aromatic acyltransferase-like n=1 Tax=Dioscorea cayennensis subsp. rotundata TaxID=55577 RepID=A0AB40BBH1_DIOCR|nr:anthocyanin 5-aromatic acyltransferase-like [Dioscorea cayenensis subsp. rotundata]